MPARPNVLLFITHDTGRFVSPYGVRTVQTPACERLAAEGVRFANSFATCPLCSPSRAACVTGRFPHQNGVQGLTGDGTGAFAFHPTEKHAARLFADAGYESVLCGFEHEARQPKEVGFAGTLSGRGDWFNGGNDTRQHAGEIEQWLGRRDKARPFYLQIGSHETHQPWDANDTPPDESLGLTVPGYLNDLPEVRREMAEMQGAVKRLDEAFGGMLAALERGGVADETIVVFTTDHGIDYPRAKGTCYDDGIGVFHFMRYNRANWGRGRVVDEMISNVDVLPTLLEAAGIAVPANMAGRSFLPLLDGRAYTPNDAIYSEKDYHDTYDPTRSIRTQKYKYIRYFEVCIFQDLRLATETRRHYFKQSWVRRTVEELYDLQADPGEATNLAVKPTPENEAVLKDLRHRLLTWMKATDDPLLKGPIESPFYRQQRAAFLAS